MCISLHWNCIYNGNRETQLHLFFFILYIFFFNFIFFSFLSFTYLRVKLLFIVSYVRVQQIFSSKVVWDEKGALQFDVSMFWRWLIWHFCVSFQTLKLTDFAFRFFFFISLCNSKSNASGICVFVYRCVYSKCDRMSITWAPQTKIAKNILFFCFIV